MEKNIPEFLNAMLKLQYGDEITKKIIEGYSNKRKVTLRVNTLKSSVEKIKKELKEVGIKYQGVSWSKEALVIENASEREIQSLEIYKKGEIYLQSLSSMLPPIILEPEAGTDILDMAAAPGGKTTQIASIVNNKASITACEMNKIRAERLKYNIEKQGATSVYVMITDARKIDNFFSFDKILLDAPCSGSGTLEINNQNLEKIFTEKLIKKSISSQLSLLEKAIKILKPGKEMVYSTCSILKEENEEVVSKVLSNENVEIVPIEFSGMKDLPLLTTRLEGTVCVQPNELYEGFFIAKIKKIK